MKKTLWKIIAGLAFLAFLSMFSLDGYSVKAGYIHDDINLTLDHELSASLDNYATKYKMDKVYISDEIYGDFDFNAVGLEMLEDVPDGTSNEISIRFLYDDEWSTWVELEKDPESRGEFGESYSFIVTDTSEAFQYKVVMHSDDEYTTPLLNGISFQYIDSMNSAKRSPIINLVGGLKKIVLSNGDLDIISRSEWGADESYRFFSGDPDEREEDDGYSSAIESNFWEEEYDYELDIKKTVTHEGGELLTWAKEYSEDIEKIIIHHTATTTDLDDPKAAIRAIYYYHSLTKGWGDIGYNYIIDQYGNIYEGRSGGVGVVGGHVAGYNIGSIGIAMLGDFENEPLPYDALMSLLELIQDQADEFNIDVEGSSKFRGDLISNLIGHRDVGATLCPGEEIYQLLPSIRSIVANSMSSFEYDEDEQFAYESVSEWEPIYLRPVSETSLKVRIENVGTETWDSDTFLVANANAAGDEIVDLNKTPSKSIGSLIESSVKPGDIGTFEINLNSGYVGGFVSFDITPIFNGYKKTSNYMSLPVYVDYPSISYEVKSVDLEHDRLENGQTMDVAITVENTGNLDWEDGVTLAGDNLFDEITMPSGVVEPGESVTFEFSITAPEQAGYYVEDFDLILEGAGEADSDNESSFELLIYNKSQQAEFVDISDKDEFYPGEKADVWIELENTGYQTWKPSNTTVGFLKYTGMEIRDGHLVETSVKPGDTGKIKFSVTAPNEPGDYVVYIKPRVNGRNLFQGNFYYNLSVVDDGYQEPNVRVALSYDGDTPVITADDDFEMYVSNKVISSFDEDDKVEVSFSGGKYQARSGSQAWVLEAYPVFEPVSAGTIMEIDDYDNHTAWNPNLNDNKYRGSLEVRSLDGEMVVINELPLEDYVKGVAEVSNTAPTEKLKAMSIIERTYALYYLYEDEKFPGMPYDLNDDPDSCQKYLGYGYELRSPNMVSAASRTEGIVVTYDDNLVKTPYFNQTNGTSTKSAQEVWGWTNTPWLVSVPDSLCDGTYFSGHGVGLSGCGAEAAANSGFDFEEIIKYYYTGVDLTHISEL